MLSESANKQFLNHFKIAKEKNQKEVLSVIKDKRTKVKLDFLKKPINLKEDFEGVEIPNFDLTLNNSSSSLKNTNHNEERVSPFEKELRNLKLKDISFKQKLTCIK